MKNLVLVIGFLIFLISSCIIGKQGVYYSEMAEHPKIQILDDNLIVVNTVNSEVNSALSIYKIDYVIDTIKKEVQLKGFQAVDQKYKNRFEVVIKGVSKMQLYNYEYFWSDPDDKLTKIEILK